MIINYINYCLLFHLFWNNWYNIHNWHNIAACNIRCCNVPTTPLAFITYSETSPKPRNWQNTSCIRPWNPPCGRRALRKTIAQAVQNGCHQQEPLAVFPGYFQLGWHIDLVSCSRARIGPGNRQIPASLKWINQYTRYFISAIICLIDIITILRIVVCFQRWYECAFEGLGSSVSHHDSRCWEQQQNLSIPDCILRHNKAAIIDTRWPNHDHVQAMAAVKGFGGKWIAVNSLDTIVFGMTQHQTVIQCKMPLAFGWLLEFQCPEASSDLKHNMYNQYKPYNTKHNKIEL